MRGGWRPNSLRFPPYPWDLPCGSMPAPLTLLRSWLKEERRLLPERSMLLGVGTVSLLLLGMVLTLELQRRDTSINRSLEVERQQRLELVAAALDDIRRTTFDWARWEDSYRFIQGRNPSFIANDLAKTSLFSSGGTMVLFDLQGRPRASYGATGLNRPSHAALVRCAQASLAALNSLSDAVQLLCSGEGGRRYLGVLTRISTNDSSAPPVGSLVMFEPLIRPAHGPQLRRQLQALYDQLLSRSVGSESLPTGLPLRGADGGAIGIRRTSSLPLLGGSLRDDLLLVLAVLTPLLLARIRLTLAHRHQRLQDLRGERMATSRIRRVTHQLDALLAELGIGGEGGGTAQQRVMAQLLNSDPEGSTPSGQQALEGRLAVFARRFQHFLDGARSLALLDTLTQLPNRRFFVEQLALEVQRHRDQGTPIALLFVDIDRFKEINDSFGHATGDEALIQVAGRLRRLINPHDFVARYGGDEFVILHELDIAAGESPERLRADIQRFAERIATDFDGPLALNGSAVELSLSLGITLLQPDLAHPEVAIQQCDMAMLQAKRNKHSRIVIFDLDRSDPRDSDYELYTDLVQAIREHQLRVLFQPIVDGQGRLRGVEALARWHHPQRGFIPPDLFISLAERHRQIHRLGDELLRQTLAGFSRISLQQAQPLGLSINISPSQLEDPSLVSRILHQLELHHLPPARLTLELTERGIIEGSAIVSGNLHALRQHGIRLSLDDFGTGYSSLSLLSQLRPDEVKIDRSFVEAMDSDPYALQIVTLISRMAPALGFQLVAEGVEDERSFQQLQRLEIDRFQGYWFARPLPSSAVTAVSFLPAPALG